MARLIPVSRPLKVETFSGTLSPTQTWTAPPGVTGIVKMVGKGQDGQSHTWQTETIALAESFKSSVGAGGAQILREDLQSFGSGEVNRFGQSTTDIRQVQYYYRSYITNFSDETGMSTSGPFTKTVRGTGTVSRFGGGLEYFTYNNAGADYVRISIQVDTGGTIGQATEGWGKYFAGGAYGPAIEFTFENVAVVPGTTYTLKIPIGGYVTIYYYM